MTLRRKFLVAFLALTLLPLGGAALLVRHVLMRHLEANAGRELQSRVEQTADSIDAFLRQRHADMRIFASSPALASGDPAAITARLEQLSLLSFFFDALDFTDLQGRLVAGTDAATTGQPLTNRFAELGPELAQIENTSSRSVIVSDFADVPPEVQGRVALGGVTAKDLNMQLLTPVLDAAGRPVGVLVGVLGTAAASQFITDLAEQTVGNELSCLLSADGRVLVASNARDPLLQTLPDWPSLQAARRAGDPAKNITVYTDRHGHKVMSGFATTEKLGSHAGQWIVLATVPYDAIMAPATSLLRGLMWLMLGLFVVAGGAGQLAARQLVRPIAEVTAAARLLTAGQLGSRALVQDTNELALLATAFNEMAAAVEQRTRERQESEDRLHVLVETVQVGVVVHDAQSRIQVCNPTARRLLDLSVTDSLSKSADDPAWKFVRADGTPMPSGEYPVNQVLATRHPLRDCVVGILTADSCVPQWVLVNADPVFDAQCQLAQVIVAFIDITERKLAENALREKTAEMESFTYKVTHDLKSPLVTIKTFLGFLEKDLAPPISAPVIKDLGYINKAADKMGTLLEELLKFAHAGINGNAHEEVPFQEIVEEALSLVAGQIAARGVQIDVSKEPVWLYGDRVRLVEVFQNLVDNAVKFLIDQPVPRIEIGIEAVGGELQIFVRDNGRGIDEKYQSKVFGLFEKLDVSISGSGLGLALVRRIVELHGGKIWVESAGLGQGTTFRFTLANTRGPQP